MEIKGIIFDFDGTLFDSMGIWVNAGDLYLKSIGQEPEKELWKTLKTRSLKQAAVYLKKRYALSASIEEIMQGINKTVEDFYFYHAMPKKNVLPVLLALREKGVKMCIATATDRYQVEAALKRCQMLHFFDAIFTCSEVGHGKDEPDIFLRANQFLQTNKWETAVFEDAYYAAKTAKEAGFFVVGVADPYEKNCDQLKELADLYIRDFSEIQNKRKGM